MRRFKIFIAKKVLLVRAALCATIALGAMMCVGVVRAEQPNIIIIFPDDQGATDLGIYGFDSNVDTPTLDHLAAHGALMHAGYSSSPKCVPSRSGLMTGRIQNEIGVVINKDGPLPLTLPNGEPLLIAPHYMKQLGYRTGQIGKWSLGRTDAYFVGERGFDDYYSGSNLHYEINYDLRGNAVERQEVTDRRNRIIVQGEAAEAFIEKNHTQPFFLYLAFYGPHLPRIEKDDPYYLNFPEVNYPNYTDEMNDIRRQGLALIKAMDDAVAGVMEKLRAHGIEENTLIFYAPDNGGSVKYKNEVGGPGHLQKANGSENVPLRGEKGTLWEGGIRVPMLAYWKGTIPAGSVINEPVWTLDFIASAISAGGGSPKPELDGVNLLPRLTGAVDQIIRPTPLYWDHPPSIAIRNGDWKLHRYANMDFLFNLKSDPLELTNLVSQNPEKHKALEQELMQWRASLPEKGKVELKDANGGIYINGAPKGTPVDPRYKIAGASSPAIAYPAPIKMANENNETID